MAELAVKQGLQSVRSRFTEQRAIDLAFLARQTMGNKNLENDILQLYRTQLRKFEPDWAIAQTLPNLPITLHAMRSAALGVGAGAIAELSKAAESDLRDNQGHIDEIYSKLAQSVAHTLAFIDQILGE